MCPARLDLQCSDFLTCAVKFEFRMIDARLDRMNSVCMFTTLHIRKRTRKKPVGKTNQQGLETGYQMTPSAVVVLVVMSGFDMCWTQLVLFLWLLQSSVYNSLVFSLKSAPRLSWLLACSYIPVQTCAWVVLAAYYSRDARINVTRPRHTTKPRKHLIAPWSWGGTLY